MTKELISILTPSYNNGDIIHRLLDSILMQTYQKIEMFVIDDGSSDNTKEIVLKYIDKFSKRGIALNYIYQSNQGQSVAINKGLKLINGEYLVWPDADDFYASNTVLEEMVNAFRESNENVGMVRTYANLLDEKSLKVIGNVGPSYKQKTTLSLFEDCLFARPTFWFAPGEYMVRVDVLSECIPELDIYTSKLAGQNWQIMLPILYRYECKTIEKFSYNILVRKMSHSRGQFNTLDRKSVV